MKKIFSLVALVGMFALMSLQIVVPDSVQDNCYSGAVSEVKTFERLFCELTPSQEHAYHGILYDKCIDGWIEAQEYGDGF